MSREKLSSQEIAEALGALAGWEMADESTAIEKTFRFSGFPQAFGFMAECALFAEKIDHHPEWSNVYRTVVVKLSTHSAKGLTKLDFDLAAFMDKAASHH
ncbi:4a-hydroxytetrahydrobiopterin dehydratase [Rhizobium sp. KVB221]|uniref:Putative pterin-4-alpha-carbinolamine dehydratase n=1 Tax=Rhizobium setariae TaxID=2801340 RepID=A0A936YWI1_9HYPH|nr:4a-hydroxytetrahydrobiopterin dehydratase [Rhizobium setariae]MBL0374655.1 4a-hydroxytetrahydrobiopterin dehydratase [Rhizobium setariae]